METIHIKFDELTAMASEHDSLESVSQRFIHDDSSVESTNTPSKEDLDNLFEPMYEEYFEKRSSKFPPIVTTSDEQTSPISMNEADELNQEDSADFNSNTVFVPYDAPNFKEAESLTTTPDPSNMHKLHYTDFELCMYALTVSSLEPKNIKEAMSDYSWIESMQDELHQFERLDVWELVYRPDGKNIIVVKWI
ncbi:retrovirus-related pol polyprotein from transposon TNT 1-94 [Tanacetum coccineum]